MNSNYFNAISIIAGWFGIKFVFEKSSSIVTFGMCLVFIFASIIVAGFYNQWVREKKNKGEWRTD